VSDIPDEVIERPYGFEVFVYAAAHQCKTFEVRHTDGGFHEVKKLVEREAQDVARAAQVTKLREMADKLQRWANAASVLESRGLVAAVVELQAEADRSERGEGER
jgi:hypothetical protein